MLSPPIALLRTQSDERLVALAQAGHERAFEAIVERYRRPLLRSCRRILPEARAEDAVQQAFLTAWRALRRGDEVRELGAWLHTILKTSALQNLRVRAYEYDELRDSLEYGNTPEDEFERRSVVRATLAGLATLPENQREALLRTAVGDRQEDIAREMGLSHGAVRQLVHRARLQLRAAATAITPLPLAIWLANATGSRHAAPVGERIGELVAGAGTAGAAATVVKAGAVAVVAGSAVTAASPDIVHHIADPLKGVQRAVTQRSDDDDQRAGNSGTSLTLANARAVANSDRGDGAGGLLTGSAGPVRLVARLGIGGTSIFDSIGRPSNPSTSEPTFSPGDPLPSTITDGTPVAAVPPSTGSNTAPQPSKETPKDERPTDNVVFDDVGPADTESPATGSQPGTTTSEPVTETPPATTTDQPAEQPTPDPTPAAGDPPAEQPSDGGGGNGGGDPQGSDPGGGIAQPGDTATTPEGNDAGKPADEATPEPTPTPAPTP